VDVVIEKSVELPPANPKPVMVTLPPPALLTVKT
jgi:hypothetical protein